MGEYCRGFLRNNQDLPSTDERVVVLREMSPQQRMGIAARLEEAVEKWRTSSRVYIEWAYAAGALKAFREQDYTCPLIHRYIGAKEIESALSLQS